MSRWLDSLTRFPIPTLPGWRYWYDEVLLPEGRIQRHESKQNYRVRDMAGSIRYAGARQDCLQYLLQNPVRCTEHLVILIPGLNNYGLNLRRFRAMIESAGYACIILDYPSNRRSIKQHAEALRTLLSHLRDVQEVSFVTHSLGGLILRAALVDGHPWPASTTLGKIVMLCPPHQGSFLADYIYKISWLRWVFEWVCGHVGHDLTSAAAQSLPSMQEPVGIIVGGTGRKWGFNPLAGEDNDNQVAVSSSKIASAVDFIQVKTSHAFIVWDKRAIQATLLFLKLGRFSQ